MQDHITWSYMEIGVRIDVRFLRQRFSVWFSVWSYMIIYDIGSISGTIVQESVINPTIRFFDLGILNRTLFCFEESCCQELFRICGRILNETLQDPGDSGPWKIFSSFLKNWQRLRLELSRKKRKNENSY